MLLWAKWGLSWRDAPSSLIVKKLSSNAEPYGGEDQETANDVKHGRGPSPKNRMESTTTDIGMT